MIRSKSEEELAKLRSFESLVQSLKEEDKNLRRWNKAFLDFEEYSKSIDRLKKENEDMRKRFVTSAMEVLSKPSDFKNVPTVSQCVPSPKYIPSIPSPKCVPSVTIPSPKYIPSVSIPSNEVHTIPCDFKNVHTIPSNEVPILPDDLSSSVPYTSLHKSRLPYDEDDNVIEVVPLEGSTNKFVDVNNNFLIELRGDVLYAVAYKDKTTKEERPLTSSERTKAANLELHLNP